MKNPNAQWFKNLQEEFDELGLVDKTKYGYKIVLDDGRSNRFDSVNAMREWKAKVMELRSLIEESRNYPVNATHVILVNRLYELKGESKKEKEIPWIDEGINWNKVNWSPS